MKNFRFLAATALAGASLFAHAGVAWAQTPAAAAEEEDEEAEDKTGIVVTGSRIARPTLESPVPITTVTADDLSSGSLNIGDALNNLPSLRSTFSQANSTRFIGTSGVNALDLRGLGTSRTLVLVDGRRHITVFPGDFIVDTNSIPSDLVERIDIVTGGSSAVYGSDAIAGVVNFVMKRDFDGLRFTGQGGISSRGDFGSKAFSGTAGRNFADGRGNVALGVEYSKNETLFLRQRDYLTGAYSGRNQFNAAENGAGETQLGDGIPDNQFFTGVRSIGIANGGALTAVCNAIPLLTNPVRCVPGSTPANAQATPYVFDPNGNLIVNPVTRDFRFFGSGNGIGGLGSTLLDTGMLYPEISRVSATLLARFAVSDAFEPFIEAKFVRIKANQEGQPSFWQGSIPGFFGGGSNLRCDNPFLNAQAFAQLQAIGRCPAGAPSASPFTIARFNVDFGGRGELQQRDTYRVVGGFRGTFNDDWKYEISGNYGRFKGKQDTLNNLHVFNDDFSPGPFLKALDAALAPSGFTGTNFVTNAAGQRVVCRVNAVTNVDTACIPINPFGQGQSSAAAISYIHTPGFRRDFASELDFTGFVAGDLSQLFELPGGPIGFVIGGEYRKEKANAFWDPRTANGQTFLNALAPNNYPTFNVKEAFGEIEFPLLKDLPFAKELTLSAAGRASDYNTSAGTTYAWNLNGVYAPIADIKFRASYGSSVRTPTPSDLFDARSENFRSIGDPCDSANIGPAAGQRAQNCAADGVPTVANAALAAACSGTAFTVIAGGPWINCLARSQTLAVLGGGNPNLTAEKGKSLTVGGVFQPSFLPGFTLTVDYHDIKVTNLLATLTGPTIIGLCYDLARPNQYCPSVFPRDPATGLLGDPAALEGPVNFAVQRTSGIDVEMAYAKTFDNGDRLNYNMTVGYLRRRDNYTNPNIPRLRDQQKGELGDATYEFVGRISYKHGGLTGRWTTRFIGPSTISTYEAQHATKNICPVVSGTGNTGFPAGGAFPSTCQAGETAILAPTNLDTLPVVTYPSVFYHDARVTYEVNSKFTFYAGMDNVFDKKPPFGLLGRGGGDPYNTIGRYFYAGFEVDF